MRKIVLVLFIAFHCHGLPEGFIHTGDLNLTIPILESLRYSTTQNFVGGVIRGYENVSTRGAVVTVETGAALAEAQSQFLKDGYQIVIYDSYRPSRAVEHFVEWAQNEEDDENVKHIFYPNVKKSQLFELGYIASRSGHSRGSTVDLTLIRVGDALRDVEVIKRTLQENYTIYYMEDGTLNMGSSFDIFDVVSHYENPYICEEHRERREYLKSVMEFVGFVAYDQEWWHFRLRNEPFPDTYFDFEMYESNNQGIVMGPGTLLIVGLMLSLVSLH